MKRELATIGLAMSSALAAAAPLPTEGLLEATVERHVKPLIDGGVVVGCVVGVLKRDETRFFGFGEVEKGGGWKPDERTIYEIGSISKVFTGTLLADASLRHEVILDAPIQRYLPQGVTAPNTDGRPITLTDLATHRSGLPYLPDNLDALNPKPYVNYTAEMAYEFLNGFKPTSPPGASEEYSNYAVGLLGMVLARKAGTPYEKLVVDRIAGPLGMADTRQRLNAEQRERFAFPYDADLEPAVRWEFDALAPCGALRSTASDLLRFAKEAWSLEERSIHQALSLAFTEVTRFGPRDKIGLSWLIDANGARWHGGETAGYMGLLYIAPEEKTAVVVLSNTPTHYLPDANKRLCQAVLGVGVEPVAIPREIPVSAETLTQYVGQYRLKPDFTLTVTAENGSLVVQGTDQEKCRVYAEAENRFFYKVVDAQITFERDQAGNVNKLVLHQYGDDQPATRIED